MPRGDFPSLLHVTHTLVAEVGRPYEDDECAVVNLIEALVKDQFEKTKDKAKLSREAQRRLNPIMKDVVKTEVLKLIDAVGAVLLKRKDKKPHVIHYASRTLNNVQMNYSTTEKELLAVVFALDKFGAYIVGSHIVIFTDHVALKYLLEKKDAKA
ncbi:unnamed protein product [Prunus armeniaca]